MYTIVLVHGAWHDGSLWERVANSLTSQGHRVFSPTIAGHGKGVNKVITHAQSVQSIVDFIVQKQLTKIILLGHSYGGTIISKVVEQIPERITRLVYHNGFVLDDGECLNDAVPAYYKEMFDALARASADNTVMLPFNIWREVFINDADIDLATSSFNALSPQPYQFNTTLDLKVFYSLIRNRQVACSYLYCTEDTALPQGEWGWHPRMSNRLGLYRLVQMPGSHEVLFTNPSLLAAKIVEAGRD